MKNTSSSQFVNRIVVPLLLLFPLLFLFPALGRAQVSSPVARQFDHLTTGFELTGAHRAEACESCHVNAVFKGTPRACSGCHAQGSRVVATPKTASHVLSSENCEACHATMAWTPATRFNHEEVRGNCATCHNGVRETGKTSNHMATNFDCGACHLPFAWKPAKFDHSGNATNCVRCHNGAQATGKNAAHVATSNACEYCHGNTAWRPATRVDHTQVLGSCFTCHNGTNASAKGATHIASDNACDSCHISTAWRPVTRVDHAHVIGACTSCHNGVAATGKHARHVTTIRQCSDCHSTLAWRPALFDHAADATGECRTCHGPGGSARGVSLGHMTFLANNFECNYCHTTTAFTPDTFRHLATGGYPGDHRAALPCLDCHATNVDIATWRTPAYKPDCAGCHTGDYKSDPHSKVGDLKYAVSELRNCSGACHEYTDTSLTTILRSRPGPQHRINSGGFN